MMTFSLAVKEYALKIAMIHKTEISGGFLSSLSLAFLKSFYLALIESPSGFCIVAKEDSEIVGFVSGTTHLNAFYAYFLSRYFLQSFFILLPKLFSSLKRIIETLRYPKKEDSLPKAELLTIAMVSTFQGKGIGGLMPQPFISEMKKRNITVFKVVVGESLPNAIAFYEKNGFEFLKNITIHAKALSRVYAYTIKA